MFPTLIKLGPITLKTYGFFVALGMFAALQYLLRKGKKAGIREENILDLSLYAIVAGLAGGRLAYVAFNAGYYSRNFWEIFRVWEGGMVFYGGLLLGALAVIFYVRKHPAIRFWALADIAAPALALGHVFGRIGCLFAGCCYGSKTALPWAVKFTNPESLAPLNVCLHPTQIYESLGNLAIFIFLDWYNRYKHAEGRAFWVYLFFYGMLRFHIEFLRGDERGVFLLGMSPGQGGSLAIILIALYAFLGKGNKE
ncbi:MAG: prolipoprotein diacylglyceryl transferase [Elusimicrobiota bacterium]